MKKIILITTDGNINLKNLRDYVYKHYPITIKSSVDYWPEVNHYFIDDGSYGSPKHPNKIKNYINDLIDKIPDDILIDNYLIQHQAIIVTYSEHVFNALRVAIHQNKLQSEQVKILYLNYIPNRDFYLNIDSIELKIDKNARLNNRPRGFFNQIEEDLSILLLPK